MKFLGFCSLAVAPLLLLVHCGTSSELTDTRTNWLMACDDDADCGSELSCRCGICTVSCTETDDCTALDDSAVCGTTKECSSGPEVCIPSDGSGGSGSGSGGNSTGSGGDATGSGGDATGSGGEGAQPSSGGSAPSGGSASSGGTAGSAGASSGGASSMAGAGGGGGSCAPEGVQCGRSEDGVLTLDQECCDGYTCTLSAGASSPAIDIYSCEPDSEPSCETTCMVTENTLLCLADPEETIAWTCPGGPPPQEVLDNCSVAPTGEIRYCCRDTIVPQCIDN